ncbi:MAG TPA: hypothetical protein PK808_03235, partial [Polymorphobacter sp.]|nr:hypothetical protein [Polymorphobacter sp.]
MADTRLQRCGQFAHLRFGGDLRAQMRLCPALTRACAQGRTRCYDQRFGLQWTFEQSYIGAFDDGSMVRIGVNVAGCQQQHRAVRPRRLRFNRRDDRSNIEPDERFAGEQHGTQCDIPDRSHEFAGRGGLRGNAGRGQLVHNDLRVMRLGGQHEDMLVYAGWFPGRHRVGSARGGGRHALSAPSPRSADTAPAWCASRNASG